jgi:hypothetical protein
MAMCSKPACAGAGVAILAYEYASRRALLADFGADVSPHVYVLCLECADKLRPPRGWVLEDRRSERALFV